MSNSPIIVALDYDSIDKALALVDQIEPKECRLKIGKEMFTRFGPSFITVLQQKGFDIFLDLKFHDIPNTVAKAVVAAADLGVWMVNVHASGGVRMLEAAKDILLPYGVNAPKLIAVTVLTSMGNEDLQDIGLSCSTLDYAERLAELAYKTGLDGVVCSAHEAKRFKQLFGANFQLVTPGIRLEGAQKDDQKRIMSPSQAIGDGADFIVIGRPITHALNPRSVLVDVLNQLPEKSYL